MRNAVLAARSRRAGRYSERSGAADGRSPAARGRASGPDPPLNPLLGGDLTGRAREAGASGENLTVKPEKQMQAEGLKNVPEQSENPGQKKGNKTIPIISV